MQPIKLLDALKQRGYHSSIATTFSVDGSFYDGAIQHRLQTQGCRNNILIADSAMLARALAATPETFRYAGRRYAVVPVQIPGCFHPKLLLRLGKARARLHVASANATAAGWCRNKEVVGEIAWERGADAPDNAAFGMLIRKAYDYLRHWLAPVAGRSLDTKLGICDRDSPWLAEIEPNLDAITLADGTAIDLLLEHGIGGPGIMEATLARVGGERIRRIVAISPYWDMNAAALADLQEAFDWPQTIVGLHPDRSEFPDGSLRAGGDLRFAAALSGDRFPHAKLILLEGQDADHVVFGSANITRAALGGRGISARNAEACIYRRLPPGSVLPSLGLDLSVELARSTLRTVAIDPFEAGDGRLSPGNAEVDGRLITWYPRLGVDPGGAMLLYDGAEYRVVVHRDGSADATLPTPPSFPLIVRFRLHDGRETHPLIVHDHRALRVHSPGSYGPGLDGPIGRYEQGTIDILDLVADLHVLFEASAAHGGGGAKQGPDEDERPETEYRDADEFRAATEFKESAHRGLRDALGDPVSAFLARVGMGCLTGAGDLAAELERERAEDQTNEDGENEDGVDGEPEPALPKSGHDAPDQTHFTPKQIERRRRNLKRALTRFDVYLAALAGDTSLPTDDVPARVGFMLRVLLAASLLRHRLEDGSTLWLMPMAPERGDSNNSAACRTIGILRDVWVGRGRVRAPLVQRMTRDTTKARLPIETKAFASMSRWMAARCCVALDGAPRCSDLAQKVASLSRRIIAATYVVDQPTHEEEALSLSRLDESISASKADTAKVLARLRGLASGSPGAAHPKQDPPILARPGPPMRNVRPATSVSDSNRPARDKLASAA